MLNENKNEVKSAAQIFPRLYAEVMENDAREKAEARFFVENGYFTHWASEHRTDKDNGIVRYSTEKRLEQYKNGEISREKAVEFATRGIKR